MPRIPEGRIINATVTKECDGKYYVSICSEEAEKEAFAHTGKEAGIDLGIRNLAVTSDGEIFDNPHSYERNLKKLRRLQRRLSRKQKGSHNREKQRTKVAALYKKIRNQRTDAIHKMTTSLVKNYDTICMEDLNVKSMVKNKRLARYISDASFGEIRRQFEYTCGWHKRKLIRVDRWYPSSQTCSECGYINKKTKNPAIRYWKCPECGKEHDRDINAAINILHKGISA